MRPGLNGTVTEMPAFFRGLLDTSATSQDDQVRHGDLLAARLRAVEVTLNLFERLQHLLQLLRLIDLPILLWSKADPRAVCAATLVGSTVGGRRRPSGRYELRDRQPRGKYLLLERGDILVIDQHMIHGRDWVLPEEFFLWNLRTKGSAHGGPMSR